MMGSSKLKVIITSPSLNPHENVSGISSVVHFIITQNQEVEYIHFEIGKKDNESSNIFQRILRIFKCLIKWLLFLCRNRNVLVHYNMPLMHGALLRDFCFLFVVYALNIPIVLHIHGGIYMKNRQRPRHVRWIISRCLKWAKWVFVLSDEEKQIIEADFVCMNLSVLPNCVDLTDASKYKKSIDSNAPLSILYMGRIERNKGVDFILSATQMLQTEGISFKLHVAGKEETDGEFLPKFSNELGTNFIYHGVVFGWQKVEVIKSCDIFLLPSFYEGLPMSLIETMSFGLVPIVTEVGGIPNLVKNGENGVYVEIKDTDSIVRQIKYLDINRDRLQILSTQAQFTIFSKFDASLYVNELNSCYKMICE